MSQFSILLSENDVIVERYETFCRKRFNNTPKRQNARTCRIARTTRSRKSSSDPNKFNSSPAQFHPREMINLRRVRVKQERNLPNNE